MAPQLRRKPAHVQFSRVSKIFGSLKAVDGISFDIYPGEFFSLLGPSGCGKTTTFTGARRL